MNYNEDVSTNINVRILSRRSRLINDLIDDMTRKNIDWKIDHEPQVYQFEDSRGIRFSVRSTSPKEALRKALKMTNYELIDVIRI